MVSSAYTAHDSEREFPNMELIKRMTTEELSRLVISNCRLINQESGSAKTRDLNYSHAEEMVGKKRKTLLRSQYRQAPILSSDEK